MRLDEVAGHFGDRIELDWKSFLLRVEPKTDDRDAFVTYTQGWLSIGEQEPLTQFSPWSTDHDQPSSSVPAHVAHKTVAALNPDSAMEYHHALLVAYFRDNRDIADADTLLDIGGEIGLDRTAMRALAHEREDDFAHRVIVEHNAALQLNVNAVPTVVLDGGFAIPGAQPTETYIRLIERIEEKRSSL